MNLVLSLMRRASIPTPKADAQAYVTQRAARGDKLPDDISDLGYVRCEYRLGRVRVIHRDGGYALTFNSDIEAREHILRRFW